MRALEGARQAGHRLAWYVHGLVGQDAYDKYVAHMRATHPDDPRPVMTERAFWRDRSDRQDANPQGRCC
ncbi:YbdD/YjiX family protein [Cellulomonas fengjieae]|uniref:YbdD/YjiX family protein n=1 Tax=Cellulomonas fengjieae TaxID=2819978 RepID=UPI001AB015E0|nr:YbdD/YjiX family protein [Cellulomonas fengjieae]MBO3102540.1 YbdD/YjiX family protein [Cellulomonas fengjieae]